MATQILPACATIPFPAIQAEQISQQEIALLLSLRNRARQLAEQVEAAETVVFDRLCAGASVESGEHSAIIKESSRRPVSWREVAERLAVKAFGKKCGELFCPKVLAGTKPSVYRYLFVL
jgi:hypothetical protein